VQQIKLNNNKNKAVKVAVLIRPISQLSNDALNAKLHTLQITQSQ